MYRWRFRQREQTTSTGAVKPARPVAARAVPRGSGRNTGETITPERATAWALGLGAGLLLLHLVLFPPVPRLSVDFPAAGEIAEREIRAPFAFDGPLLDRDVQMARLERVVEQAPVLRAVPTSAAANSGMEMWFAALADALADSTLPVADRQSLLAVQFPGAAGEQVRHLLRPARPDSLLPRLRRAWHVVREGGVADMLPAGRYGRVIVLTGQAENLRERDQVSTQADVRERLLTALRETGLGPVESAEAAAVMRPLVTPNLIYEPQETRSRQELAREAVPQSRSFIANERIIERGVQVTEQQALWLKELERRLRSRGGGEGGVDVVARYVSRALLVATALLLYGWLAGLHFPGKLQQRRFQWAVAVILALYMAGAAIAMSRPALGPLAVPIILMALLTTVLFKGRIGYTTTLLAVTILAVLPEVKAGHVFAWYVLGMVTVMSVRRVYKRSLFYRTILLLTFLSVTLIFLLELGEGQRLQPIYLVGLFMPVLSVAFGLFVLPVAEPVIGVCSDLTLLELSDLNHPLLQRMALEAQGTYHHSQVVGQLAEHAARAIDANALLTRVGALFHDIGKMEKSEYYVENQSPGHNRHDELSPSMSALVIAAHVKEGIELGRRWRLPQMVIDFIPEHHGTMVMEYFYHKALEADGGETVKVDDFRYPGPRPHSRETAILMLADAVEAATRTLVKPTPSRIKEMTKQIIDKRMLSGELDESGLSLSDIARIRDAFVPLLTGIHHARIVYPGQKEGDRPLDRRAEPRVRS
ncbi:MAG: HDIG domain-containing protein [bacterium]|nr:HDIG domain-containing protein [bacterium]